MTSSEITVLEHRLAWSGTLHRDHGKVGLVSENTFHTSLLAIGIHHQCDFCTQISSEYTIYDYRKRGTRKVIDYKMCNLSSTQRSWVLNVLWNSVRRKIKTIGYHFAEMNSNKDFEDFHRTSKTNLIHAVTYFKWRNFLIQPVSENLFCFKKSARPQANFLCNTSAWK